MTRLRSLVQELGIGMHLVSHLRRPDGTPHEEGGQVSLADLRGSGSIAQISDIVIGVERNQQGMTDAVKNRSRLRVLKNRFSGETGVAGDLTYNAVTGRLTEVAFEKAAPAPAPEKKDF
jgi:twinkle protein